MLPERNHQRDAYSICTLDKSLYVIGGHDTIERLSNANGPVTSLSPWSIIQLPEVFKSLHAPVFCPLNLKELAILGGIDESGQTGVCWIIDT